MMPATCRCCGQPFKSATAYITANTTKSGDMTRAIISLIESNPNGVSTAELHARFGDSAPVIIHRLRAKLHLTHWDIITRWTNGAYHYVLETDQ